MMIVIVCCLFFFFRQRTAYEMRISDWSSDVCSSDLKWLVAGLLVATAGLGGCRDNPDKAALAPRDDGLTADPAIKGALEDKIMVDPKLAGQANSSEESREGKECVRTCRSRGTP